MDTASNPFGYASGEAAVVAERTEVGELGIAAADEARYAQVVVLAQLGQAGGLYTYRLPLHLQASARPGCLVSVPFTTKQLQGVIWSIEDSTDLPKVRDVAEVLELCPVLREWQMKLAGWISGYYSSPLSDVLGAMLPPEIDRRTEYFLEISGAPTAKLSPLQQDMLERIHRTGRVAQEELEQLGEENRAALDSLRRKGLLVRHAELSKPAVSARLDRMISISEAGRAELSDGGTLRRTPAQLNLLTKLAGLDQVSERDLRVDGRFSAPSIRSLERKGLINVEVREVSRSPLAGRSFQPSSQLDLSTAQGKALRAISASMDAEKPEIFLLHGVTGSGKTEVYLQAISKTIALGGQCIMMVPEISLTPQAVERVGSRFPGRVAVLHSKLSAGERFDEWRRILAGEADIVVGPRSALFAPLENPRLIIVDEEHDPSYKQDSSPRYSARDAAAVLARLTRATLVFGSATPDIGTFFAARSGRIRLLELPDRPVWESRDDPEARPRPMPSVEVVDMRQELKSGNRGIFSRRLVGELRETLNAGHQALLFLNRRGHATVVVCRDCGYVARCPDCDIPFTYHTSGYRLICHRCDKRMASPAKCPECGGSRIRYLGAGTQRIEEEFTRLFPAARVLRWDRDVTSAKGAHERILDAFGRHEADVLVGTQMITKGLDFPLVTLVGVISADTGLHLPDFRAPERSFQLLTQVAGRAGRASLPSRVVVQSYTPDHYAIQAAREHDYHSFYQAELSFRKSARYPPFARLVRLVRAMEDADECRQEALALRKALQIAISEEQVSGADVIGPAPCFVARVKNRYFWQLLLRAETHGRGLNSLLDHVPTGWTVDVDPADLL